MIIVIALLASLVITAYNGITKQATEASLQTDLRNAHVAFENARTVNGALPSDIRTLGVASASSGNHLLYLKMGDGYCAAIRGTTSAKTYHVTSHSSSIQEGDCRAAVTVSTPPQPSLAGGFGIAVDSEGNVYSSRDNRIRKLTPAGGLISFAGTGVAGHADGNATTAQFQNGDNGLAIESSGSLLVADEFSRTIRRVTMTGDVTTIAGINGSTTSVNGPCGRIPSIGQPP